MMHSTPSHLLRLARPEEYPALAQSYATMDPWLRLRVSADQLLTMMSTDQLRQTWVLEAPDSTLTAAIMFRPVQACEFLAGRGLIAPLAEKHGVNVAEEGISRLPDGGYVNAFAVFHNGQGRGLGPKLLEKAEEVTRTAESRRIYLCVSKKNDRAQKFYERHGYQFIGAIENCIALGNTEHLMVKELL